MAPPSLDPQMINADHQRFQSSLSFKNRPKMLKDFLKDDTFSCSSSGFRSFSPKNPCKLSNVTNKSSPVLLRSGSKAAATTLYALNKVFKTVKFFPFASVKSSLVLPRSISSKFSKRNKNRNENNHPQNVSVKVKDILRWRSFRDLADEKSAPLDLSPSSPVRFITTSTSIASTGSTSTTTTSSKRSSWCDSDFMSTTDSPPWGGENGSKTRRNSKDGLLFEEAEQHSPVSVIDSPFYEDEEESVFPFHPDFAERKYNFMQRLEQFESLAELENRGEKHDSPSGYNLLFDFFKDELSGNGEFNGCENFKNAANSWIYGEYTKAEDIRDECVKDMERGVDWKEFKEERKEMAMGLEIRLLNDLLDQFLNDMLSKFC